MASYQPKLDAALAAFTTKSPFVKGTVSVPPNAFSLFYRADKESTLANVVDLAKASKTELDALQSACTAATFGRENKDVLDESYRKAGKMDLELFSSNFDIHSSGVLKAVHEGLVAAKHNVDARVDDDDDDSEADSEDDDNGAESDKKMPVADKSEHQTGILSKLYKLNVYGEGSFFKPHKDTPRGDTMFGSVVIVFPSPHEGGALVLRHKDEEWTVDFSHLQASQIGYVAFYSDVEHEVLPVTSGHRVTLTYNLFYDSTSSVTSVPTEEADKLKSLISNLLDDATLLPRGGYLGFGLSFQYPVEPGKTKFAELVKHLKGIDNLPMKACTDLDLSISLKAVIDDDEIMSEVKEWVMVGKPVDVSDNYLEYESWKSMFANEKGTVRVHDASMGDSKTGSAGIVWVAPLTSTYNYKSPYMTYGNEASIQFIYADLALVVPVGPAGDRANWKADEGKFEDDANFSLINPATTTAIIENYAKFSAERAGLLFGWPR